MVLVVRYEEYKYELRYRIMTTKKSVEISAASLAKAEEQYAILARGIDAVLPDGELVKRLAVSIETETPLKVKAGFDPTAPHLHLGHAVLLQKLRMFQQLGHTVQFLVGDFTARIGDPTGRNETRPPLSDEDILANAKTYEAQVFKLLDRDRTDVVYNSTWLESLTPADFIRLMAKATVAQMLERDDFKKRYQDNAPISLHELVYPLMQGQDSVALESDIELGGTDQRFNLLVGRDLQQKAGQIGQIVMMLPILEGLDGVQKMSKSLGNAIGIDEPAAEMYGKLMSISDQLMDRYVQLLTDNPAQYEQWKQDGMHPMERKKAMASEIVGRFHDAEAATQAAQQFSTVVQGQSAPEDIEDLRVDGDVYLPGLVVELGWAPSKRVARDRIASGALTIDGERCEETSADVAIQDGSILKFGKRNYIRIRR